jgi:hypothetical protein
MPIDGTITFRLPAALIDQIDKIATASEFAASRSGVIRSLIEAGIKSRENGGLPNTVTEADLDFLLAFKKWMQEQKEPGAL